MSAIRFVAREKGQFSAELRSRVQRYFKENDISTKGNQTLIVKAAVLLLLTLAPTAILIAVPMPTWAWMTLAIVQGIGGAGVGMCVMHDALHGSFSKKNWINKLLGQTMHLLGGCVFTWKVQHNLLHHTYTNILGHDEDIRERSVLRFSSSAPVRKLHRYQHWYALFLYPFGSISMSLKDFSQLKDYDKAGIMAKEKTTYRRELLKATAAKLLHAGVFMGLPMLFSALTPLQAAAYFLIMHLSIGFNMSVVFQFAHVIEDVQHPEANENGVIENEWTIHQLATTANFCHKSPIITWYTGGLNYQVEHHLFPNISHVHYPALSDIVKQTAEEYGVFYNRKGDLMESLASHLRQLRKLGNPELYPEKKPHVEPVMKPVPEPALA